MTSTGSSQRGTDGSMPLWLCCPLPCSSGRASKPVITSSPTTSVHLNFHTPIITNTEKKKIFPPEPGPVEAVHLQPDQLRVSGAHLQELGSDLAPLPSLLWVSWLHSSHSQNGPCSRF